MKNFKQFFTSLFILALALSINSEVYSQWTLAGLVTNPGTFPSISVVDQNIVWVAGGPTGTPVVARSTNAGANWTSIPTSQLPLELYCVWGIDANTCYVANGGAAGGAGGNASYYKTTDAGVTWTVVLPADQQDFLTVLYSPKQCLLLVSLKVIHQQEQDSHIILV